MKRRLEWLGLVLSLMLAGAGGWSIYRQEGWWRGNNDLRIGLVSEKEIELVAFSPARRMINRLVVPGEMELWIPRGLGWYRTDRLLKLLTQESKVEMLSEILFYNFGFVPDKVILATQVGWGELGWWSWFKWKLLSGQMLSNEETVTWQFPEVEPDFDEMMPRDLADNRVLNEAVRVVILNTSEAGGLANFIARRLEWMGLSVVSVDNLKEATDGCLVRENLCGFEGVVNKLAVMLGCGRERAADLECDRVELYLGREFASMIKYSSYVRSF